MLDRDKYITNEERDILQKDISSQLDNLKTIINDESKMQKKKLNIHIMKEGDCNDE